VQYNDNVCAVYCQWVEVNILDKLNFVIAENLKRLREDRKLSLDNVAKLSGVSKSMLGQIERGEVNPTVSTVWKISNGLKISFTQLMSRPEADIEIVNKAEIQPFIEDGGKIRNYPVFPFDSTRRFEMYSLEIDEDGYLSAEAHPQGTQEFITVFSGEVTINVSGEDYVVTCGNSMRFKADSPHTYKNNGDTNCALSMVIYYPQ
jgi:XRE family transcriptional regulator, regulator of sulfur utilization